MEYLVILPYKSMNSDRQDDVKLRCSNDYFAVYENITADTTEYPFLGKKNNRWNIQNCNE